MPLPSSTAPAVLQNRYFHLEVFEDAGPRISKLIPAGTSQNLLGELENVGWDSPYGTYEVFGGHRLWAAPEIPEITYMPEADGANMELTTDGARLWRRDAGRVDIERSITISLEQDFPRLRLVHTLVNLSSVPLTAAPWALSVLPVGSRVRIPMAQTFFVGNPYLPNRSVIFWPYADPNDPRFKLTNKFAEVTSDPARGAFKAGVYSPVGWAAAEINGWLLIKRFTPFEPDACLDLGANVEVYTSQAFLEFETVGRLRELKQGEMTQHVETWEVFRGCIEDLDENGVIPDAKG